MTDSKTAVFGLYKTTNQADMTVGRLRAQGLRNHDISVLFPDSNSSRDLANEENTKDPESAANGATAGGAIGGTLGLLTGIGALAIPGLGPFIAAGPIIADLAGLGVGGAVGGLIGALVGMGIPEYEAKHYEGRLKDGGVLLSVYCSTSEKITRAKDILKETGAEYISSSGEIISDTNSLAAVHF